MCKKENAKKHLRVLILLKYKKFIFKKPREVENGMEARIKKKYLFLDKLNCFKKI